MENKGVKKYDLHKNGVHASVVDKLIKDKTVDTTTINKFCELLNCQPCDITEYLQINKEIKIISSISHMEKYSIKKLIKFNYNAMLIFL